MSQPTPSTIQKNEGIVFYVDFPTDHPRPVPHSFSGKKTIAVLGDNLSTRIDILCTNEIVSPCAMFLACFEVVLYRYTSADGIDVTDSNRICENRIHNTDQAPQCPLTFAHFRQDDNPPFWVLLKRVQEGLETAGSIVELPNGTPEAVRRFNVCFDFREETSSLTSDAPARGTSCPVADTLQCDLSVLVQQRHDTYEISLTANGCLFEQDTLERFLGHYRTLIEAAVADPTQTIAMLPLLTPEERHQILVEWNSPALPNVEENCLHETFEAQVKRTPDRIAIIYRGEEVTYEELNQRANRLAYHLKGLGVGPEQLVGVCLGRSIDTVVALLAILKAGGAYLPLDPQYPRDRIEFMLQDAQVSVLLTEQNYRDTLPEHQAHVVLMDQDSHQWVDKSTQDPPPSAGRENLAYVLYTSGSTGLPKGVALVHRSAVALVVWANTVYSPEEYSGVLFGTSICFDLSVFEIFAPLSAGGRIILAKDALELAVLPEAGQVTLINTVPSVMAEIIRMKALPNSVLTINLAGEYAPQDLVRDIYAAVPVKRVYDLYGATEDTTHSTLFLRTPEGSAFVGRPFPSTQLYVLDSCGQPVPIGVPGEIHLGGIGLARGYLNRPELTAVKFLKNPFVDDPDARIYRTGDLGRFHADGNLEYLGRIDHQVKIRGFRVELGEIESVLNDHPGVDKGVVVARKGENGETRLVAYIVYASRSVPRQEELRSFLSNKLPSFMIPSVFVHLNALPLTPSGKIDRKALPDPGMFPLDPEEAYVAPRTETEKRLTAIWSEVLGVNRLGIRDSFLEIGGHSLSAIRLISRIEQDFGLKIPIGCIIEGKNVETVADHVETLLWLGVKELSNSNSSKYGRELKTIEFLSWLRKTGVKIWAEDGHLQYSAPEGLVSTGIKDEISCHEAEIIDLLHNSQVRHRELRGIIQPVPRENDLPLSFGQEAIWLTEQLHPGDSVYNEAWGYRVHGCLEVNALVRAIEMILQRHEVLRTVYKSVNGTPVQHIQPPESFSLSPVNLTHRSNESQEKAIQEQINAECVRPFDLVNGPLFRCLLLHLSERNHILFFTAHHTIFDDWSISIFEQELRTLYDAYSRGMEPSLVELPVQYADYACWQRGLVAEGGLRSQISFWKQQLENAPAALDFPTDYPRPAFQTFAGMNKDFMVDENLSRQVIEFCQEQDVTPFIFLLTVFKVLLYRHTGQDDLIVGSPMTNRGRPEIDHLIGYFLNTLVLRTHLSGEMTFKETVKCVREVVLNAFDNSDTAFENLVAEIKPERDPSRNPLFQVAFVFRNLNGPWEASGITFSPIRVNEKTSHFDITLYTGIEGKCISGSVEYNTKLFNEFTIQRVINHFQMLLAEVVCDPEQPISCLPLLTEADHHQILVKWNETRTDYPRSSCIHEIFEEQVAKTPDAIALAEASVKSGEPFPHQLTYAEVNEQANKIASYLIDLGVSKETFIGLFMDRSLEMVVSIIGILKAGCAYLPLDRNYPKDRLKFMLDDTNAPVLLTISRLRDDLPEYQGRIICLDMDWENISQRQGRNCVNRTSSESLAYVMYTSGSTGKPKGVCVPHRAVVRLVKNTNYVTLSENETILQFAPISFDASTFEIWGSLLNGGRLVVFPPHLPTVDELGQVIQDNGITTLWLTASLFGEMVDGGLKYLKSVRQLLAGGETLSVRHVRKALEALDTTSIINGYGPTENTTFSCYYKIESGNPGQTVPIGRPISNTQVYLLDSNMCPVPIGVSGELHVGGDGLAVGYLNRLELTAEKFVRNPFSEDPDSRLYKTGDLARYRPNGEIEFLGRMDQQVKIRGFRIEPGEIESVLNRVPNIPKAVVLAREDTPGDKLLVAYLLSTGGKVPTVSELRAFLNEELPDYMIPSTFVFLDTFPMTPNGKIDRKALPAPSSITLDPQKTYVAPRTEIEKILTEIWSEVLGVKQVGIHDDFFEMGGHSLAAIRLVSRIEQKLDLRIPLNSVLASRTVERLEAEILDLLFKSQSRDKQKSKTIQSGHRGKDLPLSFAQESVWLIEQLHPGNSAYNVAWGYRVHGILNIDALVRSIEKIQHRHEILRTVFKSVNGTPFQTVRPRDYLSLPSVNLSIHDQESLERTIQELVDAECERAFDLENGPLFRSLLLRLSDQDHILLFNAHHTILDEWSITIIEQELRTLYGAYSRGLEPALGELPVQYADYACWQRDLVAGGALENQMSYWRQQLENPPAVLDFPTDYPRPALQTFSGRLQDFVLDENLSRQVIALCQERDVTPFIFLLTVFKILLYRYTGQKDLIVGSPMTNRGRPEIDNLIGYFLNSLVLRTHLSGDMNFTKTLECVRAVVLEAFENSDVAFEKIVAELQLERDPSRNPLFQIAFIFRNLNQPWETSGITFAPIKVTERKSQFDMTFYVGIENGYISGSVEYNTKLFNETTIKRLIGHFQCLLEGVIRYPQQNISTLPLLTETEHHKVIFECNDTQRDFSQDKYIHQLFEEQVLRSPDSVAVHFEEESLTYLELDHRANQLARYLAQNGVTPGEHVGICMSRSLEMIVGLLGILKAGGCYIPLDPAFPPERLKCMIEDSKAYIIVTEGQTKQRLPETSAILICLDEQKETINQESGKILQVEMPPSQLVYIMFTSGSTGRPKGVQIKHRSVVNFLHSMIERPGITSKDTLLAVTTISFDISVLEIFLPLVVGARIVLTSERNALDGQSLVRLLEKYNVTVMQATPVTWRILLESGWRGEPNLKVLCGGEALSGDLADLLLDRCGELWNMYGPTETTIWSMIKKVERNNGKITIGKPIRNTQVYVLDEHLQPRPIGIPGELYIGGEGLSPGYLDRPALTAERFFQNPFMIDSEKRLYRTGDLVKLEEDGEISYLGRMDHQVKLRGFRIELGEIETLLSQDACIQKAVVTLSEDSMGDKRLVAYLVPNSDVKPEIGKLRRFLSERLPDYMIPSAFVFLDKFPITQNGKIDRKALPKPDTTRLAPEDSSLELRSKTEKILGNIWSEILGITEVNLRCNFFELGGHSLTALRVVSSINKAFSANLPPGALFENPTIEKLSKLVKMDGESDAITKNNIEPLVSSNPKVRKVSETIPEKPRKGQVKKEPLFTATKNRLYQILARLLPGATTLRVALHRARGVNIGNGVWIGYDAILETSSPHLISIGDNASVGMRVTIIAHFMEFETVTIEEDAFIGPGSLILPGVTIGRGAVVSAGSVVAESVPAMTMVQGNPARPVAKCSIPMRKAKSMGEFLSHVQWPEE